MNNNPSFEERLREILEKFSLCGCGKCDYCIDIDDSNPISVDEALLSIKSEIKKTIEEEPELPGDMPDEMWDAIKNDKDAIQEALKIVVRQTKESILSRTAHYEAKKEK